MPTLFLKRENVYSWNLGPVSGVQSVGLEDWKLGAFSPAWAGQGKCKGKESLAGIYDGEWGEGYKGGSFKNGDRDQVKWCFLKQESPATRRL